jgi:hypothetical protein
MKENIVTKAGKRDYRNLRNLIRFQDVAPHLARLLSAGGIWTLDNEDAYERLVWCRIGQVRTLYLHLITLLISP